MTKLFDVIDAMVASCASVPELASRVQAERVLPLDVMQLPRVCLYPRRGQPGAMGGEAYARESTVLVVIRTAGDEPGRAAHELLSLINRALLTDVELNDGTVQIDLSTETFRYMDAEQSMCDLQAEYELTFEVERDSLL